MGCVHGGCGRLAFYARSTWDACNKVCGGGENQLSVQNSCGLPLHLSSPNNRTPAVRDRFVRWARHQESKTDRRVECLKSGPASLGGCIWRPLACANPNLKAPPNAAFLSLFLEDARLLSFVASNNPRFLCVPKKEERKRKNGNIAWHRSSLSRAWAAEIVTSG